MNRCIVVSAAALSLVSTVAAANEQSLETRGYLLSGELLVFPRTEQGLPTGWSISVLGVEESNSLVATLKGAADLYRSEQRVSGFVSQAMSTAPGQFVLTTPDGRQLGLGDLSVAIYDGKWCVISHSSDLAGRPVFELPDEAAFIERGEQFSLTGELVIAASLADELGIPRDARMSIGALTVMGSAMFDPARPVTLAAPAATGAVIGPDVIVSTIGTTFGEYGIVSGTGAYAVTTVSCNVGDQIAIWIDSGSQANQHPVIGTQLYRFKTVNGATRFEQIGMSWLKHGFCAADAPNCTAINPNGITNPTYVNNPSCDWLGLFATDTYSDGLNASQSGCGPRSEIQPWTGVFPYPYQLGNPNASTAATYKRLQVKNPDLDPTQNSGATYFGEVVYICTDEPAANRYNNYSVRRATVGATNASGQYNMSFADTTIPLKSAVMHWATIDPGVVVSYVDVPNDGRIYLARKVTNVGGGQFHYEYVLFNMNSDRGAQAISIPLGAGSGATSIEFKDVDYHSGEPYVGTDWTNTLNPGSSISWAAQTFTQNANANALRWSTSYNFRFRSTGAPAPGTITVNLFKPGTPTQITFTGVDVPGGSNCPDTDGDGANDCVDLCPNDPAKQAPGQCGCGVADTDGDGDGVANCVDGCPNDPAKSAPGVCGCGNPDTDGDGDGVANCVDGCPNDPLKTAPGVCGCGVADGDIDGDGDLNCVDNCPTTYNPAQADADQDGVGNVCDNCTQTANSNQLDSDSDFVGNACDNCPNVFNPPQGDADGDNVGDSCDGCPNDANKSAPGVCGCGVADTDSDGDGTPNCNDLCPNDPAKVAPGTCGCGVSDADTDGDGIKDCNDNCDAIANPTQADCDQDSVGDACEIAAGTQWDVNNDGTPDQCAACPSIVTYCSSSTTSSGCSPVMSASGNPSVGAASGFVLTASNVEGQKQGLLFYGVFGPKASVWAPGNTSTLCVKSPIPRATAVNTGGAAGGCNGTISLDFQGFLATHPTALGQPFQAGAIVNVQAWFRDPAAPGTTNLSNALQFKTCP